MNGAEALIETLYNAGIAVCFANPGTSEMQLVAAIDKHPDMRGVLGLFEGVVTGAADGYGRMADKPAATLLHLGPGLANGLANLHNARRGGSPVVNVVGDHATDHQALDAPLSSDIESLARPMSAWVRASSSADDLAALGAEAVAAAAGAAHGRSGAVATLIAPANHAWEEASGAVEATAPAPPTTIDDARIDAAAAALKSGAPCALFAGGLALREDALDALGRIAAATGARLLCETFPSRLQRGAGRVPVERLPYFGEMAAEALSPFAHIILAGAKEPVAFFAYPGKPGRLAPEASLLPLVGPEDDIADALERLAAAVSAPDAHDLAQQPFAPPPAAGKLDAAGVAAALSELMPEDAIVSDEAATAGLAMFPMTQGAPRHDWITLTGGSIGQSLPVGVGAAIACPDRKVICLQADGSAMYTVQALWTMAREKLDVTTVILNNGSYAILNIELARVGVQNPGPKALSLLDLTNPALDWVALSEGMGVPACKTDTAEGFRTALADALAQRGPRLIEAVI